MSVSSARTDNEKGLQELVMKKSLDKMNSLLYHSSTEFTLDSL